jgi:hypothetical protein
MEGPHTRLLVFVGPGMVSFEQLASAAARKGVRTAWVGYPSSWLGRARMRLFVPSVRRARDVRELAHRFRQLGPDHIADIQTTEYYLADVLDAAREAEVSDVIVRDLERRQRLADKLFMAHTLGSNGVRAPATLDASVVDADTAVRRLGLPLMVKGRVSSGGTGVRMARSVAEAERAVREVSSYGGALYEEFVTGESLSYSAAYDEHGRIVDDVAYSTARVGRDRTGPPDRIVTVDDPCVLAIGRRIVGLVGGHGLLNINLIRDPEGTYWVHDVNLRPWGTLFALRAAGIDFTHDYLVIRDCATPLAMPSALALGEQFDVFPSAAVGLAETQLLAAGVLFALEVRRYLPWTGLGYVVGETLRSVLTVARRRRRTPESEALV